MSKPKATADQILHSIGNLIDQRKYEFYLREGSDAIVPLNFRREEIQKQLEEDHEITYSDAGFRSRLKRLCKQGILHRWRLTDRTVFYTLPQ